MSRGQTFRSFRTRNFRLFFQGQLVSQCGNWASTVAQILLVLSRTDSGVAVGALVACQFGPVLVLGAWAGLVADRSDRHRLLLTTQVGMALKAGALAALTLLDQPPLAAIYGVVLAGGFVTAFDNPVRRTFVGELVAEEDVHNAVSLNSALNTAARVVGPAVAGILIETVGYTWCFVLDGASYLLMVVTLRLVDPSQLRAAPLAGRAKGQIRAGLLYVRRAPELWIPLVMVAVLGTFAFNFQVVLPLFVQRSLDGDGVDFTILYSVLSAGALLGALVSARAGSIDVGHAVAAAVALAVAMGVLAAAPNLGFALPVSILVGATSSFFVTTTSTILQLRSAPGMRGRVMALQSIVLLGSTPIGGPLLGATSDLVDPRASVWIGSISALAAAGWAHHRLGAGSRPERATRPARSASTPPTIGRQGAP